MKRIYHKETDRFTQSICELIGEVMDSIPEEEKFNASDVICTYLVATVCGNDKAQAFKILDAVKISYLNLCNNLPQNYNN